MQGLIIAGALTLVAVAILTAITVAVHLKETRGNTVKNKKLIPGIRAFNPSMISSKKIPSSLPLSKAPEKIEVISETSSTPASTVKRLGTIKPQSLRVTVENWVELYAAIAVSPATSLHLKAMLSCALRRNKHQVAHDARILYCLMTARARDLKPSPGRISLIGTTVENREEIQELIEAQHDYWKRMNPNLN